MATKPEPIRQYEVELIAHIRLPTSATHAGGAGAFAHHAVELAFANLPEDYIQVEVVKIHDV